MVSAPTAVPASQSLGTVRVAFLGARHPHIFPRLSLSLERPDVEVLGLFDPDTRVTEEIGRRYHVKIVSDVDQLLDAGPHLVIIEGYDPENPGYVRHTLDWAKSAAGGRPEADAPLRVLMIEKPGAPNLQAMQEMVAAIEAAGVHAQLGYMYAYSPVVEKVRKILADGVLGPVTLARFHAAAPVGCAAEIWQSLPQDMGGVFFTDGCHMLDLVVRFLGPPVRVSGQILRIHDGPEVVADIFKKDVLSGLGTEMPMRLGNLVHEDAAVAVLEYPRMLAIVDVTGWEAHNWVEAWRIELYGADGTLYASLIPPGYRLWVRRARPGYERGWHSWEGTGTAAGASASLVADEPYQREIDDLIQRVREARPPDLTRLKEGLEVVRIAHDLYESAQGR